MATPVWEQSKENVAPLVRGRDVAQLERAIEASPVQREAEKEMHENAIREAAAGAGPYANDPLAPWVTYVKWAVANYPAGAQVILNAIETPCRAFSRDKRYREDIRFVRLWIRYADVRDDQLDVFAYMRTRRIGTKAALFYEGWATTLEFDRQYNEAEKVYVMGLEIGAKPSERLLRRQKEFFNRMSARARRKAKKDREAEERKEAAERVSRAPPARPRSALADRILSHPPSESEPVQPLRTARPALGSITEHQAESGVRPMTKKQPPAGILRSRKNPAPGSSKPPKPPTSGNFQIFADPSPSEPAGAHDTPADQSHGEEFPFPSIAKIADVSKENSGQLPSKWAGETLKQDEAAVRKMKRITAKNPSPAFEVFQDESDEDEPVVSDQYIAEPNAPVSDPEQLLSPPPPAKRRASISAVSPTINTKIAMQQVDEMFSSDLPMERERQEAVMDFSFAQSAAVAQPSKPQAFDIFCDEGDDKENVGRCDPSPSHAGPSGNPALEKRVLQPIPEMEGPFIPASHEEVIDPPCNGAERASKAELMNALAAWCYEEPSYNILDGEEPMVDLGTLTLRLTDGGVGELVIDNILGLGHQGVSKVVTAEPSFEVPGRRVPVDGNESDEEGFKVALKVSCPDNVWEFYVYKTIHARIEGTLLSVPRALMFFFGPVQSYLVLDGMSDSSIANALSFEPSGKFPEHVAMFLTVELLKTLEAIHGAGIIHSDITLDNVMLRFDLRITVTERLYNSNGDGGWGSQGILLVDYNHSTDTRHQLLEGMSGEELAKYVSRDGNAHVQSDYRIPNASTWGFNADCYGAAVCSRKMLGLKDMDVEKGMSDLRHAQVWETYFGSMQRLSAVCSAEESVAALRICREEMEQVIRGDKWLKNSVSKVMIAAMELQNGMDLTLA